MKHKPVPMKPVRVPHKMPKPAKSEMSARPDEMFSAGYAIPIFSREKELRRWRFRDEEFTLPFGAVPVFEYRGWWAAGIDAVRTANSGGVPRGT